MSRIIITGAASMLGIALINECVAKGDEVTAIVRPGSLKNSRLPQNPLVKKIEHDLGEIQDVCPKLHGVYDSFYHLGWTHTDKEGRNKALLQKNNVDYTLAAVKTAKDKGCSVFIGTGSQAEYGRVNEPINPLRSVSPESAYGIAKYSAGKLSALYAKELGIKHVWARVFSAYGPYDAPSTMIMYAISKFLKKEKPEFTKCEQLWDYIYCGDAAKALYLLGLKGKDGGVYNIGSGQAKPLSGFIEMIKNSIDPALEAGIGSAAYAPDQVMYLCADISRLKADTGFEPAVAFEEGIKETIKWARENTK